MIDYKCNKSFEKWLNYLVNIISSIFQIQPDEINFPNRGGSTGKGAGSSVNEGSTAKTKMQQSQDKGLEPLFNYIEDFINNQILTYLPNGKDYYFRFNMGDTEQALQQQQLLKLKEANGMTMDEARAEMKLPPLSELDINDIGNIPGGPAVAVQFVQTLMSQDSISQYVQQHKNDMKPGKDEEDSGMPAGAVGNNSAESQPDDKEPDSTVSPD